MNILANEVVQDLDLVRIGLEIDNSKVSNPRIADQSKEFANDIKGTYPDDEIFRCRSKNTIEQKIKELISYI